MSVALLADAASDTPPTWSDVGTGTLFLLAVAVAWYWSWRRRNDVPKSEAASWGWVGYKARLAIAAALWCAMAFVLLGMACIAAGVVDR